MPLQEEQSFKFIHILLWASLFWILMGGLHLGSLYLEMPAADRSAYLTPERWGLFIWAYLCWSFFTAIVYRVLERTLAAKNYWQLVVCCLLLAPAWLMAVACIRHFLAAFLWGHPVAPIGQVLQDEPPFMYVFNLFKIIMTYGVCGAIVSVRRVNQARIALLQAQREAAQLSAQHAQMELQGLHAQLSPHFLFNALNSIVSLARQNAMQNVVTTLTHLADLLRYALANAGKNLVPLADELEFTQHYIALQTLRFAGKFNYTLQDDVQHQLILCPPFCVQTLIENVFAHNELTRDNPVHISVVITKEADKIHIQVTNSLATTIDSAGTGLALANIRSRLFILFGTDAQLQIRQSTCEYTAQISLPVRTNHD
jgi:two-component system, LytTR family, sensor histidine kinase AlgZ